MSLVLLLGAPTALADTTPTGSSTGVVAATTDTTQTAATSAPNPATAGPAETGTPTQTSQVAGPATDTSPPNSTGPPAEVSGTSTSVGDGNQPATADASGSSTGTNDTSGSGTTTPNPTIDPGTAPTSSSQTTQAGATTDQSGASNGNVSVRVDESGSTAPVSQANQATSAAASSATGNTQPGGPDPTATASASTTQTSPSNANIDVRIDSAGDIGAVNQQNTAQAGATSSGIPAAATTQSTAGGSTTPVVGSTTSATGPSPATPLGGQATATAAQTGAANMNVIVRVGSPGDNGPVTQENTVGATAGSGNASTGSAAGGASQPNPNQYAVGSATVTNQGDVVQAVQQYQNGEDPGDEPFGSAAPPLAAGATHGSATATQTGARNTNVSIRVGSPGTDGAVTQSSGAGATGTSPGLSVVNVTDGRNTNVSVVLPGAANGAPGDQWQWNWSWTGSGTPPNGTDAAAAAPTSGSVWTWNWTTAQVTQGPAAPTAGTPGLWTWTWTWVMADGQQWTFSQTQACSCSWQWSWTWDWSKGAPPNAPAAAGGSDSDTPVDGADDGAMTQINAADSSAEASTSTTTTQFIGQNQVGSDPALRLQQIDVNQRYSSTQSARAWARAVQKNPANRNWVWGVAVDSVSQSNTVSADAAADVAVVIEQQLAQAQIGDGATVQWIGAQQWVGSTQDAQAAAYSEQTDALNLTSAAAPETNAARIGAVEQSNQAVTVATATIRAYLGQWLAQIEDAGVALDQEAGAQQLTLNTQVAAARASGIQTRMQNIVQSVVQAGNSQTSPAVRQRNLVQSTTTGADLLYDLAAAVQVLGGGSEFEIANSTQTAKLQQIAIADSNASQHDGMNRVRWLGVSPPPPPVSSGNDGDGNAPTDDTQVGATGGSKGAGLGAASRNTPAPAAHDTHRDRGAAANHTPRGRRGGTGPAVADAGAFRGGVADVSFSASAAAAPAGAEPQTGASSDAGTRTPGAVFDTSSQSRGPMTGTLASGPTSPSSEVGRTTGDQPSPAAGVPNGPSTPWRPGAPGDPGSAGSGPSGSAPATGGGSTVLALGSYKLAAPAQLGPQMPAPVLGRPVVFLDPFERPG